MARKLSMKDAINEAIDQEMRRDPTVIVMGEDIVGGTGSPGELRPVHSRSIRRRRSAGASSGKARQGGTGAQTSRLVRQALDGVLHQGLQHLRHSGVRTAD